MIRNCRRLRQESGGDEEGAGEACHCRAQGLQEGQAAPSGGHDQGDQGRRLGVGVRHLQEVRGPGEDHVQIQREIAVSQNPGHEIDANCE